MPDYFSHSNFHNIVDKVNILFWLSITGDRILSYYSLFSIDIAQGMDMQIFNTAMKWWNGATSQLSQHLADPMNYASQFDLLCFPTIVF